ncbi:MAG TPA: PQQ-like beta-propeller repeat protein [Verrucomicrobiota bacterium]|nr:PQQ-like beta-propeller repeat protein [Verrucomicrobiota bacterium]
MHSKVCFGVAALASWLVAEAGDWPQWRGPHRDGQTSESVPAQLPSTPEVLWRVPLGHGYSAPIVAGQIVLVMDDTGGQETAHALAAATGKKLWSVPLGDSFADEFEPGPRCTPVIEGDRVYAQTAKGELRCLSLADGSTRWRTNFADFGATWNPDRNSGGGAANRRGNCGSPVITGDRLLVQVGSTNGASIVAFDKLTGRVLWKSQNDLTCYSSPVVARLAGRPQFVTATCEGLLALAPENGSVLWRVPFKTGANRNVLTPLLLDDTVYFASYTTGLRAVKVQPSGAGVEPVEQWLNRDLKVNLSSPVAVGGFIYGLGPSKDFICVDRAAGQKKWAQSGFGDVAATIAAGDRLLVLTDLGELRVLAANPDHYEELGRVQVSGKTYSHPALANGVLYVRDPRELQAVRLAARDLP